MAAIFIVIFAVIATWVGLLSSWSVAYATGLAQQGIWSTLLSLVPFVSIWVSLKQGALTEIPQSTMRTHWSCSLKASYFQKNLSSPDITILNSGWAFLWGALDQGAKCEGGVSRVKAPYPKNPLAL